MAASYYNDYSRPDKESGRSLPMLFVDGCMSVLTLLVCTALLLTLAVPFVAPSRIFFFPLLGLLAPAVYVAAVLLALYWIIRWRWIRAGALLFVLLLGSCNVPLFYRMQLRRDYGEPEYGRGTFKVMTYNVRAFYGDDRQSSVDRIAGVLEEEAPDIVCLQEYNPVLAHRSEAFVRWMEGYAVAGSQGASDNSPIVILSKFPIIRSDTLDAFGGAIWADLRIGEDTVRVFSNHLHTTEIKAYDDEFLSQRLFLTDSTRWSKMRSILHRHRKNSELRAEQVDRIAPAIAATQTRYIVCGDFNDTPMSYVYRTMARGSKDAFSEAGKGYSHTFRGFLRTLRIDYVLRSEGLEALSYEVPEAACSDHLPVVVRMQKRDLNP